VSEKKRTPKKRTGGGGQRRGAQGQRQGRGGQGGGGQGRGTQGRRSAGRGQPPGGVDETVAELAGPLRKVLDRLPETQRKVLELRMGLADGHPHDLGDTARALGLSLSETRDIEKRAFEHIREAIPLQQLQRFLQR
jgi:DNA-directed RNA polymerase specialized sigma24 family protein